MSKKQEALKASIKAMPDRALQETSAYFANENEKHLRSINNTLNCFFWIISAIGIGASTHYSH